MHAFTHSLTHRAPSATRPRVRWQPYTSLSSQPSSSSSCTTKSPPSQLSTPSTSISSPSNTPLPESKSSIHPQNIKENPHPNSTKKQFAAGLVDQTVKTLSEIWRPQDIPAVFIPSRPGITIGTNLEPQNGNNVSLPCLRMAGSIPQVSLPSSASDLRSGLAPIKGFVHEVLRRSRTSGCVLQTALCYLEAIRPRVPDLLQKEQAGLGVRGETDISIRITPATELELKLEEDAAALELVNLDETVDPQDNLVSTVRVTDLTGSAAPFSLEASRFLDTPLLAPTVAAGALPSPLLCPRRTFLASLILASKFTQDKCYSNRAWAKLSGLPPREIGRCERALGEALEWRLWVGKTPVAQPSQPSPATPVNVPAGRPVVRSQSESNILNMPSTRSPFLVRNDPRVPSMVPGGQRTLHRCPTVPVEMFSSASPPGRAGTSQSYRISQEQLPSLAGVPPAFTMFTESLSQSPSPDNPGLSYSPSSTESSSGDRTIQMSTFIDEPMATYSASQAPAATEFWPYSDSCEAPQDIRISPVGFTKYNRAVKAPAVSENIGIFGLPSGIIATSEQFLPSGYPPSNPHWLLEAEYSRPLSLTE